MLSRARWIVSQTSNRGSRRRSQVGIGFLYVLPVVCGGWWYGKTVGVGVAAGCVAIYVFSAAAADVSMLAVSVALRGVGSIAIVGDVVGHGLRAAQMATFTRISLISIISGTYDPAEILKLANRAVHARTQGTGEFVTAACVAYHPSQPSVRWASAGHPLPIALPHGAVLVPTQYAAPLGFDAELKIASQYAPLAPADAILLYSDGLYEARGRGEQPQSDVRLSRPGTVTAPNVRHGTSASKVVSTSWSRIGCRASRAGQTPVVA